MKKYFSRLLSINSIFSIDYTFNAKEGLSSLTNKEKKRSFATVCLLERDVYWRAERQYSNVTLFDLPKIIKAELRSIAPFSGHVFWRVKQLSTSQITVVYFALPTEYIDKIRTRCQFIYPLGEDFQEESQTEQQVNLHENITDTVTPVKSEIERISQKNIVNLVGFYLPKLKNETLSMQRLSFKKLATLCAFGVAAFTVISSAYLHFSLGYYKSEVAGNAVTVENALKTQRELRAKAQSKLDFDTFGQENPNVLAILSSLSFNEEKYFIQRIHLHPKGVKITGTAETSATNLLTLLLNHPAVSEAKFARALAKNRAGEEVFVIEVVFHE
ncbi:hypothetical protein GCM10009111_13160 [Colwellia asteriadis]|uniref:Uncharacterized protein n=1 Tax=Colwellia asteriadis TaxID=517723 RepID=A0ABN1L5P3_9GAMM